MSTPDKCPHCGSKDADSDYGNTGQRWRFYECGTAIRPADNHSDRSDKCKSREEAINEMKADRQKVENELDETLHRIKERGEEIERLRGEKCAAQGEAERERLARIKMHDEMERQACLATELRTELAETRRKLEEWKATAKALWRGVMAEDDDQILQGAMMKASRLIEEEKGGVS